MEKDKFNKVTILSLFNVALLSYTAWAKYSSTGCRSCSQMPFLPLNSVGVAVVGVIASLALAAFSYFSTHTNISKYIVLPLATVCAGFASFLQVAQFLWTNNFCYLCLTAATVFYLIFGIMFYKVVFKSMWSRINAPG